MQPVSFRTWATAPILVQTTCVLTSSVRPDLVNALGAFNEGNPKASRCLTKSAVDLWLVLLHRRKGSLEDMRRLKASIAPGVGSEPTCKVPETSISNAEIEGLLEDTIKSPIRKNSTKCSGNLNTSGLRPRGQESTYIGHFRASKRSGPDDPRFNIHTQ